MDARHIAELFAPFGPVKVRSMFGGAGIYADGKMFALVSDGVIYLKTDDRSRAAFEREGSSPFTYTTKDGRRAVMSYWRLPERLYDDPDELARWAKEALATAQATSRRQAPRKRKQSIQ
jgi:DNA transformation protein and related proteins